MTSNVGQDNASCSEDHDTYTDQTFDDDYDDCYYDTDGDYGFVGRKTDLVFHGLTEGLEDVTDEQLVDWVLEDGLGLDPSQYVEEVERFGRHRENQVRPIRVKIRTVDKRNEILRLAKNLRPNRDFRRIYIQPWLTRRGQKVSKELREKVWEFRRSGHRNVKIVRWKIVQHVNGKDIELYTAQS